jgi:hypothetical protein
VKTVWKTGVTALCLAGFATAASGDEVDTVQSLTGPSGVTIQYAGSVMVFQIANIIVDGNFEEETYAATARFTSAGLAALFTDADIEAGVSGYRDGAMLDPWRYSHLNHASNKNRIVGIDFPEGVAMPDVNPPFGSMGEPPATDEERAGARDPLSTLLSMTLGAVATVDSHCDGRLPVFDGRARYNLRFEDGGRKHVRTRAWSGEALICHAYYEPVSGYEADEYPTDEEIAAPISFWLAPMNDGEFYVPVKIRTNVGFGSVTVVARSIQTR